MPSLTMAADMSADTWLGASAWARGSHGCSGTAPALDANPARHNRNTPPLAAADREPLSVRIVVKSAAVAIVSQASPNRRAMNPAWVMAAYQTAAGRTCSLWRCSVITSNSDVTAINSHTARNVGTLPAAGTNSIEAANTGSTPIAARDDGPWPSRPAYPMVYTPTTAVTAP